MRWAQLDTIYNFAQTNDLPFNFHTLLSGNQQPTWMWSLPPARQLDEIKKWFAAVAARYPDIDWLQVVNEGRTGSSTPPASRGSTSPTPSRCSTMC